MTSHNTHHLLFFLLPFIRFLLSFFLKADDDDADIGDGDGDEFGALLSGLMQGFKGIFDRAQSSNSPQHVPSAVAS